MSYRAVSLAVVVSLTLSRISIAEEADSKREKELQSLVDVLSSGKDSGRSVGCPTQLGDIVNLRASFLYTVHQVLDDDRMLIRLGDRIFLLRGMSTDGFADGLVLNIKGVNPMRFLASGTETYATASGGTNTVFVVDARPELIAKELLDFIEKREREARTRTWTSSSGTTVDAEFLGYGKGNVTLKRSDTGKDIEVPMLKLNSESRSWVQSWLKGSKSREELRKKILELEN